MAPCVALIERMPDVYEPWSEPMSNDFVDNDPHAYTTSRRCTRKGNTITQPPCDICGLGPGFSIHLWTLPGFESAPVKPSAALPTLTMTGPSNIDKLTAEIEQRSPLFGHSAANPQQSLF